MTLLNKEDEPFAAREKLQELACSLYQVKLKIDVMRKLQVVLKEKEITTTSIFATYKRCALSTY